MRLLLAFALLTRPLGAQSASAMAEALFLEGRQLLDRGDLAQACGKLAESQRLEPSSGTLLNVADCHEREGKTATAWAEFQAAERMARAQGRGVHAAEAQRRAQQLAGRVSRVEIHPTEALPGAVVRLGGVALAASSLDSPLPVDPGEITVSSEAPGHTPWSARITIAPGPGLVRVQVPPLPPISAPAASAASVAPVVSVASSSHTGHPDHDWPARRTGALVTGGAGVVALGLGATFGLLARSTYLEAERACPSHKGCSPDAMDTRGRADTQVTLADVGFGLGIVAVGVATYLWLSAPASHAPASAARWRLTASGLRGEF